MDQAFSEALATSVWKLFPFRSGNRVWVLLLLKAYFCCIFLGFILACILNAVEGKRWLKGARTMKGEDWGVKAYGDSALDECFWFVFTTMHGIGFGEFMARGVIGRLIAMFCCAIGYWFTIFMMSIVMLSQLPGEKAPSLYRVVTRMWTALWPSYSVFLATVLAIGAVIGKFISKDHEGKNEWPTGMYWAWTCVHRTPYGDIWPDTVFGRVVTIPIACMGVLYLPYALACIAVRRPTLEQHRELIGHLRSNPEDSLGRGYVEPPEAASNGSLQEFVMHDSYIQEDDDDSTSRGRSCIAICILLSFALCTMFFFGGSPAEVKKKVEHTLELDLPPGLRSAEDPVPPLVWVFWLHDYPMEGQALEKYSSLNDALDVDVQMVTPDILEEYNVTDPALGEPFHKALNYLSPNHKVDYLRAYFMHYYGGGVLEFMHDRKDNSTWTAPFEYIGSNESFWFMGTPSTEKPVCDESNIKDPWCQELHFSDHGFTYADTTMGMSSWSPSKGPCCAKVLQHYNLKEWQQNKSNFTVWPSHNGYIMRKGTAFTKDWLKAVHDHLSAKLAVLKLHTPPAEPCCKMHEENKDYPLRWDELRGEIWSSLLWKYRKHMKFENTLV